MMNFHSPISRKNFLKGSLALTAGLLLGAPQAFAASTEYPHSPEEATGETAMHYLYYLYLSAVNYFAKYTADFQVDVEMSAHGWVDDTFPRLEKLKHRRPGQPHPFVIGQKKYRKYEDVFRKMAQEAIKKYQQ